MTTTTTTIPNHTPTLGTLFSLIDTYLTTHNLLTTHLSTGHFSLSQTKYSLGPLNISSTKYDQRMQAVSYLLNNGGLGTGIAAGEGVEGVVYVNKENEDDECNGKDLTENEQSIRSRKPTTDKPDIKSTKKSNSKDPIKWFAFLPPPSLKSAQSEFINVLALSVELARIKREIESLLKTMDV